MDNQTVTPENVKILSGETEISVKITPSTGDANYADTYVIEAENGKFPSGTLKVSVSENCKSYSGTAIKAVDMPESVVFDENGKATISLKANRTGTITLTFGIEDSDMTEDFQIAVIEPEIYEIYEENQPEETIIYGDVNGDNDVTMEDVVLIRRYIAGGWDVTF